MNKEVRQILAHPTADVPEVGRVFYGLTENASYAAAKRGEIECVRIGRKLRAKTLPLRKLVFEDGRKSV